MFASRVKKKIILSVLLFTVWIDGSGIVKRDAAHSQEQGSDVLSGQRHFCKATVDKLSQFRRVIKITVEITTCTVSLRYTKGQPDTFYKIMSKIILTSILFIYAWLVPLLALSVTFSYQI